jgi:cyanase
VLIVGAVMGQMKLTKPQAANAGELFGLSKAEVAMLNEVPMRGDGTPMPPTDPLIYRFYEMVMVNGPAWKALIEEEFGDGIMSAIDFDFADRARGQPEGDRVKITMSGKFLRTNITATQATCRNTDSRKTERQTASGLSTACSLSGSGHGLSRRALDNRHARNGPARRPGLRRCGTGRFRSARLLVPRCATRKPARTRSGKAMAEKIIAMRLDHETDHGACCDVGRALSDQIRIHRGVEIGLIDRVVDVAIGIVVHPARGDVLEMAIGVSPFRFWTRVGHAGQRLRALVLALPGTAPFSAARPSFTDHAAGRGRAHSSRRTRPC